MQALAAAAGLLLSRVAGERADGLAEAGRGFSVRPTQARRDSHEWGAEKFGGGRLADESVTDLER